MPQARLPDVNTGFNYHRGKAVSSWQGRNYTAAVGSLYAFNGELPDAYRVKISTKKYNELTRQDLELVCPECEQQTKFNNVKIMNILTPLIVSSLTGQETMKMWHCNKCDKLVRFDKTKKIQKVLALPAFLKVVPEPPQRKDGLMDRKTYDKIFSRWFWQFLDELEAQAAQFRDDNWQKEGNIENEDVDTEGEFSE